MLPTDVLSLVRSMDSVKVVHDNAVSPKETASEKILVSLLVKGLVANGSRRVSSSANGAAAAAGRWACSPEVHERKVPARKVTQAPYMNSVTNRQCRQSPPKKPIRKCSIDAADVLDEALRLTVSSMSKMETPPSMREAL